MLALLVKVSVWREGEGMLTTFYGTSGALMKHVEYIADHGHESMRAHCRHLPHFLLRQHLPQVFQHLLRGGTPLAVNGEHLAVHVQLNL